MIISCDTNSRLTVISFNPKLCSLSIKSPIRSAGHDSSSLFVLLHSNLYSVPLTADYIDSSQGHVALYNRTTSEPFVVNLGHFGEDSLNKGQFNLSYDSLQFDFGQLTHKWDLHKQSVELVETSTNVSQGPMPFAEYFICDPSMWPDAPKSNKQEIPVTTDITTKSSSTWLTVLLVALALIAILAAVLTYIGFRYKLNNLPFYKILRQPKTSKAPKRSLKRINNNTKPGKSCYLTSYTTAQPSQAGYSTANRTNSPTAKKSPSIGQDLSAYETSIDDPMMTISAVPPETKQPVTTTDTPASSQSSASSQASKADKHSTGVLFPTGLNQNNQNVQSKATPESNSTKESNSPSSTK